MSALQLLFELQNISVTYPDGSSKINNSTIADRKQVQTSANVQNNKHTSANNASSSK